MESQRTKKRKLIDKAKLHGLAVVCVVAASIYVASQLNRLGGLLETRFTVFGTSHSLYDSIKQNTDFFIEQWKLIPIEETGRQAELVEHWLTLNYVLFIGLYEANGTLIYKSPNSGSIKQIQAHHARAMTVSVPFVAHDTPMQIVVMVDTHSERQTQEKQKSLILGLLFLTASVSLLIGIYFSSMFNYLRDKTRK